MSAELFVSSDTAEARARAKKAFSAWKDRSRRNSKRLRAAAEVVRSVNSDPDFDPALVALFSKSIQQSVGISSDLVLALPEILLSYAAFIEPHPIQDKAALRRDKPLRLAQVRLLDYIRDATKRPHYEAAADLVTAALEMGGLEKVVSAQDLRKLSDRNPTLKSRLLSAWPRLRFLRKLAQRSPSLGQSLKSYPYPR